MVALRAVWILSRSDPLSCVFERKFPTVESRVKIQCGSNYRPIPSDNAVINFFSNISMRECYDSATYLNSISVDGPWWPLGPLMHLDTEKLLFAVCSVRGDLVCIALLSYCVQITEETLNMIDFPEISLVMHFQESLCLLYNFSKPNNKSNDLELSETKSISEEDSMAKFLSVVRIMIPFGSIARVDASTILREISDGFSLSEIAFHTTTPRAAWQSFPYILKSSPTTLDSLSSSINANSNPASALSTHGTLSTDSLLKDAKSSTSVTSDPNDHLHSAKISFPSNSSSIPPTPSLLPSATSRKINPLALATKSASRLRMSLSSVLGPLRVSSQILSSVATTSSTLTRLTLDTATDDSVGGFQQESSWMGGLLNRIVGKSKSHSLGCPVVPLAQLVTDNGKDMSGATASLHAEVLLGGAFQHYISTSVHEQMEGFQYGIDLDHILRSRFVTPPPALLLGPSMEDTVLPLETRRLATVLGGVSLLKVFGSVDLISTLPNCPEIKLPFLFHQRSPYPCLPPSPDLPSSGDGAPLDAYCPPPLLSLHPAAVVAATSNINPPSDLSAPRAPPCVQLLIRPPPHSFLLFLYRPALAFVAPFEPVLHSLSGRPAPPRVGFHNPPPVLTSFRMKQVSVDGYIMQCAVVFLPMPSCWCLPQLNTAYSNRTHAPICECRYFHHSKSLSSANSSLNSHPINNNKLGLPPPPFGMHIAKCYSHANYTIDVSHIGKIIDISQLHADVGSLSLSTCEGILTWTLPPGASLLFDLNHQLLLKGGEPLIPPSGPIGVQLSGLIRIGPSMKEEFAVGREVELPLQATTKNGLGMEGANPAIDKAQTAAALLPSQIGNQDVSSLSFTNNNADSTIDNNNATNKNNESKQSIQSTLLKNTASVMDNKNNINVSVIANKSNNITQTSLNSSSSVNNPDASTIASTTNSNTHSVNINNLSNNNNVNNQSNINKNKKENNNDLDDSGYINSNKNNDNNNINKSINANNNSRKSRLRHHKASSLPLPAIDPPPSTEHCHGVCFGAEFKMFIPGYTFSGLDPSVSSATTTPPFRQVAALTQKSSAITKLVVWNSLATTPPSFLAGETSGAAGEILRGHHVTNSNFDTTSTMNEANITSDIGNGELNFKSELPSLGTFLLPQVGVSCSTSIVTDSQTVADNDFEDENVHLSMINAGGGISTDDLVRGSLQHHLLENAITNSGLSLNSVEEKLQFADVGLGDIFDAAESNGGRSSSSSSSVASTRTKRNTRKVILANKFDADDKKTEVITNHNLQS